MYKATCANNQNHLAVQGTTQPKDCGKFKALDLEASCNHREHLVCRNTIPELNQNWQTCDHDYTTQNWDHLAVQGSPGDLRVHQGTARPNDCVKFKARLGGLP